MTLVAGVGGGSVGRRVLVAVAERCGSGVRVGVLVAAGGLVVFVGVFVGGLDGCDVFVGVRVGRGVAVGAWVAWTGAVGCGVSVGLPPPVSLVAV